jgi:RNA polymerase sigma factor (sigma-70 family)
MTIREIGGTQGMTTAAPIAADPLGHHLVQLAGTDQQAIATSLAAIERATVKRQVSSFCRNHPHVERDDALQLVRIAICQTAHRYDPARPAAPWLAVITRRRLITYSLHLRTRAAAPVQTISLSHPSPSPDGEKTLGAIIPDRRADADPATRELAAMLVANLPKILSSYELDVVRQYAEGATYAEIAAETRHSSKSVDNALHRARGKIHKAVALNWTADKDERMTDLVEMLAARPTT